MSYVMQDPATGKYLRFSTHEATHTGSSRSKFKSWESDLNNASDCTYLLYYRPDDELANEIRRVKPHNLPATFTITVSVELRA